MSARWPGGAGGEGHLLRATPEMLTLSRRIGCSALATLAVWSTVSLPATAAPSPARRILILHQSPIGGWVREKFDAAFAEHGRSIDSARVDVYEETLDVTRFPGTRQSRLFSEYLKNK